MKVEGTITRINYYNKVNGYGVVIISLKDEDYKIKRTKNHLIGKQLTITSSFDRQPLVDEEYSFEGNFIKDPNYGLQFKATSFTRKDIYSTEGVINYLSSPIFKNIGIKTAKIIVNALGVDAIDKIAKDKTVLEGLGINAKNIDTIYYAVLDNRINEQIIMFFLNNGLSIDLCHKIIAIFGATAIETVKEQPYILMEKLDHFGFLKNDKFALKMGIEPNSSIRLNALLLYILKELIYNKGDSFVDTHELHKQMNHYLTTTNEFDLTFENYQDILNNLAENNKVFLTTDGRVFDYDLHLKEINLAQIIADKLNSTSCFSELFTDEAINKAYRKIQKKLQFKLNSDQENAVINAFKEPFVIITGGPGTGKTTIIKTIVNLYTEILSQGKSDNSTIVDSIALLAPTGRAAKRLKEVTLVNASTIHKYLGYTGDGHYAYDEENKTSEKLLIVDESSMLDLPLAYQLFSSIGSDTRCVIVGDVDQLPSVGPGQVLKDLIDSKEITTIRLTKIHRQDEGSKIIELAHDANEGLVSENIMERFNDRYLIPTDNEHLLGMVVDLVKLALSKGKNIRDIQILAPMYRCNLGINEINDRVQNVINPKKENEDELVYGGSTFRLDDKVIQLVNRSEKKIMNGDIGYVHSFLYQDGEITGMSVSFDFGIIDYTLIELEDLKLAYAISIHKAQGSEFDIVIMPLTTYYQFMFKRKLIYTGLTRAKKLLILIGDINAYRRGITRIEQNRQTILREKIKEFLNKKNQFIKIDDKKSAFSDLGEYELELTPFDFLDKK